MIKEFSWNGHIEKAELVKKFDDIKTGKIYWEENCSNCGGLHRALTLSLYKNHYFTRTNGDKLICDGFKIIPKAHCCKLGSYFTRDGFNKSNIYCVINEIKNINEEIQKELLDKKLFVNS